MHVSSTPRIKPHIDLARQGFQPVRTRVSTSVENRRACQLLALELQMQAELNLEARYLASGYLAHRPS